MIRSRHFPFYFKFKTIFDACPQLQKLEMWNVRNLVKEPIGMFAQLRELEWGLLGRCGQGEDYEIELTNILLAAPNLEKLSLAENSEYALSVEDLRKLTSLVVDKKILCKLTSIRLEIRLIPEYELNYDLLRALRDFVAVAAVRLPDLVEFYFLLFGHDSEDLDEILEIGLCSSEEEDLMKIAEHFEDCIGDSTIADFIRAINARKQQ
ncbi:uncharacterized protein LOC135935669 [Cloeon dipterum]|uniref:uncharacterized protein LOC135935669 n=1 Tax=Cloeon dipterum TaxID=197152 RepID=UPI00322091E3